MQASRWRGCAGVAALALSVSASAATFDLQAAITGAFDQAFNPVPIPDMNQPQPGPVILQIDVTFEISNFAPGERNWANVLFDVDLFPGLTDNFGWAPNTETVDLGPIGPIGDQPKYADNRDAGPSSVDLQAIIVSIAGGLDESDPRSMLGESGPELLGSLFLEWDGVSPGTLDFTGPFGDQVEFSVVNDDGLFDTQSDLADGPSIAFSLPVPVVPEPVSLGMLAIGGLGLLGRRVRCSRI